MTRISVMKTISNTLTLPLPPLLPLLAIFTKSLIEVYCIMILILKLLYQFILHHTYQFSSLDINTS